MVDLSKYDSTSERLDNTTFEERLIKFSRIFKYLEDENIKVVDIDGATVYLEDDSCGFKMGHNIITWEVFRAVDVADMIMSERTEFLNRTVGKNK